jgi:hypothetical protein
MPGNLRNYHILTNGHGILPIITVLTTKLDRYELDTDPMTIRPMESRLRMNGFQCNPPFGGRQGTNRMQSLTVEFSNPDGSLFVQSVLRCDATEMPSPV